jgi:O-antigen ligase
MTNTSSKLDRLLLISLVIFSPFFLFPSLKNSWVLLVIFTIWTVRIIINKKLVVRGVLDWPILILVIQIIISCFIVPDLSFSLAKIIGAFYGIAVYYALLSVLRNEKQLKASIQVYLAGGALFSVIGLIGMKTIEKSLLDLLVRIKERLPHLNLSLPGAEEGFHPNAVGGILILIIPLFLILMSSAWKGKSKKDLLSTHKLSPLILLFGFFITSGVLILTQSRSSIVGLLLSFGILLFGVIKQKRILLIYFILFLFVSFLIFLSPFIILVEGDSISSRLPEFAERAASRTEAWTVGIEAIKQDPLTGTGMNRLRLNSKMPFGWSHAHNHLVHTAAEMGIPALIALISLLTGAGLLCIQIWKKADQSWVKMTALGLGAGQFAHLIFGAYDSIPLGAKPGIFFWLSLALITALHNSVESDPEKK